jgi:hypothetical protein
MYISIFALLFSLYKTIEQHTEFLSTDNLKNFLLPIILTITFLPFIYLFNLYAKYEILWTRLNITIRNNEDRKRLKRHILLIANLEINKLVNISKNIAKPTFIYNDFSKEMIKHISKKPYVGYDE